MTPDELAAAIGVPIRRATPVSGGDVNHAHRVELDDGRTLFVKSQADPQPDVFGLEADGLMLLRASGAIRVPEVIATHTDFLALEWIEPSRSTDPERLGRELADLHRSGHQRFGLDRDNYVGAVAQRNTWCDTWPEFYATRRLEPLVRRNVDDGRLPPSTTNELARLVDRLDDLCGPVEPPSLLHGDLWGGNLMTTGDGQPVLIDPAVHYGHREVDLAMMRLFGGFSAATFAAYDEHHPLAAGHQDRVRLYQLHPLLVHVTMFGGGYGRSFLDALHAYL